LWELATSSLSVLVKVCPAHTNKAEIKCMGSAGGKALAKPKGFVYYTLALSTLNEIKLISMCFALSKHG
jgi:hypothetical protein